MFRQETRALDGLCIAGCSRSLPLPVPYLSTHGCRTVCLRGFGGRVFSGSDMQRCTNTEPGAVRRPSPRLTTSRDVHHETRALNALGIARCSRALPLPVP